MGGHRISKEGQARGSINAIIDLVEQRMCERLRGNGTEELSLAIYDHKDAILRLVAEETT